MTSNSNMRNSRSHQAGLTLVELMVSLVLGLVLAAGIISVYLESKRNFAAEEEMARIQENGRYALSLLKRELMLAGFYGGYLEFDGLGTGPTIGSDCDSNWALDIDVPVDFINDFSGSTTAVSGASLDKCLNTVPIQPGTDVLVIKRTAGEPTAFDGNLTIDPSDVLPAQIFLKITDYGDQKSWYHYAGGDAKNLPDLDPNDPVEYWEMYTKVFFIRNYSVTAGDGVPTLCVKELVADDITERCLVEGVENMQVVFGTDTDGDDDVPNLYVMDPNDLNDAVTARVYLLMRSLDELAGTEAKSVKSFQLGTDPNTIDTNDAYLRRIFSTTVQTRNAILPSDD